MAFYRPELSSYLGVEASRTLRTLLQDDMKTIHEAFFGALDLSRCRSQVEDLWGRRAATERGLEFIGEGNAFRSYKCYGSNGGIEFALKVATEGFFKGKTQSEIARWIQRVEKVSAKKIPLIPPLKILRGLSDDHLALVMPYGYDHIEKIGAAWKPLQALICVCLEEIKGLGLRFDDFLQVKVWRDIPFIYDLSDLIEQRRTP